MEKSESMFSIQRQGCLGQIIWCTVNLGKIWIKTYTVYSFKHLLQIRCKSHTESFFFCPKHGLWTRSSANLTNKTCQKLLTKWPINASPSLMPSCTFNNSVSNTHKILNGNLSHWFPRKNQSWRRLLVTIWKIQCVKTLALFENCYI